MLSANSITLQLCKLFESIVSNIVYSHVEKYIAIEQDGFVKNNLCECTHFVSESLDNKLQVDVIYTDMSKAFDMVNHCILLHKLRNFGICRNLVLMFQSLISNRIHYVEHKGYISARNSR